MKKRVGIIFSFFMLMVHNLEGMKKLWNKHKKKRFGVELTCNGDNPYMTKESTAKIKKLLLEEPEKILEKYFLKFGSSLPPEFLSKRIIGKLSEKNPIFLLNDCLCCLLSRLILPEARKDYTKEVVKHFKGNSLVDLGSCGLLQLLEALANKLEQDPKSSLIGYCIDPYYRSYLNKMRTLGKQTVEVTKSYGLTKRPMIVHGIFKQALSFLKVGYPNSSVRLFAHAYVNEWIKDYKNKLLPSTPRLIISSDLPQELTRPCDFDHRLFHTIPALEDYDKLVSFLFHSQRKEVRCVLLQKKMEKRFPFPLQFPGTLQSYKIVPIKDGLQVTDFKECGYKYDRMLRKGCKMGSINTEQVL